MDCDFVVDHLTREALQQCARANISIQRPLMRFVIQWLRISYARELRNADEETTAKIYQAIYNQVLEDGPVVRTLKLKYYFNHSTTDFDVVQAKYENITKTKLVALLENICTFTGSSKKDLDEVWKKMTVYIVAVNKMFSTKNVYMLEEAKCALRSILSTQDLLDFVTRKKHYRLKLLDRVGRIMCGILIFNKHAGLGAECIRDVISDIQTAYKNTLETLRLSMKRSNELIAMGLKAVSTTVTVNLAESKLIYRLPKGVSIEDLHLFNKFNYLHLQYESYLQFLKEPMTRLKYSFDHNIAQLNEAHFKLKEVIQFRLAIPTEMVFPHFTELFDAWYPILMQLYYLVEINKINDDMTDIISLDYPFEEMAAKIGSNQSIRTYEIPINYVESKEPNFRLSHTQRKSIFALHNPMARFCAFIMTVSQGILIQADPRNGLLPFQDQQMAFRRKDFLTFTEKNYNHIVKHFLRVIFQNPEMGVLFNISMALSPLNKPGKSAEERTAELARKIKVDAGLQTEHCLPPATLESKNTYSWNIWDYRRRAIQLANLRKCKTNSIQTNITYSSRDAEIQTYYKETSTHTGICSSSQLSRSACHILDETEKGKLLRCPIEESQPENDE